MKTDSLTNDNLNTDPASNLFADEHPAFLKRTKKLQTAIDDAAVPTPILVEPLASTPEVAPKAVESAIAPSAPKKSPGSKASFQISDDDRIIGTRELTQRLPFSLMQIWRLEKQGKFPPRLRIGDKKVGWFLRDIQNYIANVPRGPNSESAPQSAHTPSKNGAVS